MRAVLFDLDGTLIDTGALYAESYRRAFEAELETPPTIEAMFARKPSSERYFLLEWYGAELGDRIHRRVCETYEALAPSLLGGLFEGVPAMLEAVRRAGLRTGIVTGKSRRAFEVTCAHLDLEGFEVVVLEDDVARPKPDPQGILQALAALGVDAHDALYVGDTPTDAEAAVRAGARAAAALWARSAADRERVSTRLAPGTHPLDDPMAVLDVLGLL
jgi:phosphoglycolate phosphatase/pyrophosphatase PpaX